MKKMTKKTTTTIVIAAMFLAHHSALGLEVEEVRAHRGEFPPGNIVSPSPVMESDIVQFVLNADGMTYGNGCFQGTKSISVDEQSQIANVVIVPLAPDDICTLEYDPVNGVEGEIGPLWPGIWTIQDSFGNSLQFDVAGSPLTPGDANGDGQVDSQDLNAVGLNWQLDGKVWVDGDFNGDGTVDAGDLNLLALHWQSGSNEVANSAVPEPSTNVMMLAILVAFFARARGHVSNDAEA